MGARLLVLELGSGFNTPTVVRMPMEQIVSGNPLARFVRVNLSHADIPADIAGRSVSLQADALHAVRAIAARRA
jgi:hypothetical protein